MGMCPLTELYFVLRIALFASAYLLFICVSMFRRAATTAVSFNAPLIICFIASVIVMAVAADAVRDKGEYCGGNDSCERRVEFAVAVGAVSTIITGIAIAQMRFGYGPVILKYMAAFLLLWWAISIGILTSNNGPFTNTLESAK